jgi:hypothetical protein
MDPFPPALRPDGADEKGLHTKTNITAAITVLPKCSKRNQNV